MQKVLSTKLRSDEVDHFTTMAEQQGESKCSLLKHIVQDYLDGGSKSDTVSSPGVSNPTNSLNKGLLIHGEGLNSEYLPLAHHQLQNTTQKCNSVVDSTLPIHKHIDHPIKPAFLSISGQPFYNNVEPDRSITPPKQSSGICCLILLVLLVLCQGSWSTTAVEYAAEPVRRKPILGVYH